MVMSSNPATATMSRDPRSGGDAFERLGDEEFGDLGVFDRSVDAAPRDALTAL